MNRPNRTALFLAAGTAAVSGLLLAGCGGSAGATSSHSHAPATTTSHSAGSAGPKSTAATGSAYFPFAVGNTWVYDEKLNLGHATVTNKVLAITSVASGRQVTMAIKTNLLGAAQPVTKSMFIVHPDGSISVPLTQLGSTEVKIQSGSLTWPSAAELASGQPQASTIVLVTRQDGHAVTLHTHVLVRGDGSATVTVPAGTYRTTIIQQNLTEHYDGYAIDGAIRTWVANGVGPVQSEFVSKIGGVSTVVSKEELRSFTKG
jgi:hypothetical protein